METWALISRLHTQRQGPWFIGGDFNEILNSTEKEGGMDRVQSQMAAFNNVLVDCSLTDIGFSGFSFTWSNNRASPNTVRCRLDRVCANGDGLALFPAPKVTHLAFGGSDHCPILCQLRSGPPRSAYPRRKPFRFEALWITKSECANIVKEVWSNRHEGSRTETWLHQGNECRARLMLWSRDPRLNPQIRIAKVNERLGVLAAGRQSPSVREEHAVLSNELEKLYEDQAAYWQQRSKTAWLKEGDRNTSFFHAKATTRASINQVVGLLDRNGGFCDRRDGIEAIVAEYFGELFTSTNPEGDAIDDVLGAIDQRITDEANQALSSPFTPKEVLDAFSNMSPLKSRARMVSPSFSFRSFGMWLVMMLLLAFLNF